MTVRLHCSHKKTRKGNIFLSTSAGSGLNMIRRVIANTPSFDNRQIPANGQFTTDLLKRSATLMTLSQTSCQVTVPQNRVGITVFCIIALPRDRHRITARKVNIADTAAIVTTYCMSSYINQLHIPTIPRQNASHVFFDRFQILCSI